MTQSSMNWKYFNFAATTAKGEIGPITCHFPMVKG